MEDLHWSDPSTLDLISWLSRRQEPARLLLLGSYRPGDAQLSGHPLRAVAEQLRLRAHCAELVLTLLTAEAVTEYLARRCPGVAGADHLAALVHRRTDGNPLFMENLLEHWISRGSLVEEDGRWSLQTPIEELEGEVPDSLRQLIERQLERLVLEDQAVLEVASAVGTEFSTAAVAAALEVSEEEAEGRLATLDRRAQFIVSRDTIEWSDSTVTLRFAFLHELYQAVLYGRLTPSGGPDCTG